MKMKQINNTNTYAYLSVPNYLKIILQNLCLCIGKSHC